MPPNKGSAVVVLVMCLPRDTRPRGLLLRLLLLGWCAWRLLLDDVLRRRLLLMVMLDSSFIMEDACCASCSAALLFTDSADCDKSARLNVQLP